MIVGKIINKLLGKYTGTDSNEKSIMKRAKKEKKINISAPSSYREILDDGDEIIPNDPVKDSTNWKRIDDKQKLNTISSTAIKSARYDPTDDSLNITYKGGNQEYKFKAGGASGIEEWLQASSKGRITQEWKSSHRFPGY